MLNCELSRLLRHLPIDEINKMFCPESSLSLLQVDVGGEKNVILISGGGKKNPNFSSVHSEEN